MPGTASSSELVVDVETTGLEPWDSRLACIVAAPANDPTETYAFDHDDEAELLDAFTDAYATGDYDTVIGYNVLFDLRFIFARALVHNVDLNGFAHAQYQDLMSIMKSVGHRYSPNDAGTLDDWASAIFDAEKHLDSSTIPDLYTEGRTGEIVTHCRQDVELTGRLWNRITTLTNGGQFK